MPNDHWQSREENGPDGASPGVRLLQSVIQDTVDPRELTLKLKEVALGVDAEGNALNVPLRERRAAIISLLDRGWGKPVTAVELSGSDGKPIEVANATPRLGFTKEQLLQLLGDPRLTSLSPQLPEPQQSLPAAAPEEAESPVAAAPARVSRRKKNVAGEEAAPGVGKTRRKSSAGSDGEQPGTA